MQACSDLLQVRLLTLEHRSENLCDPLAQTAGAGAPFQFGFTQLQQMPPGAGAMIRVAQRQAALIQLQLIRFGAEDYRPAELLVVARGVVRGFELDVDRHRHQRLTAQAAELRDPAGEHGIDDEAVVGVVRTDGIKAQPGA